MKTKILLSTVLSTAIILSGCSNKKEEQKTNNTTSNTPTTQQNKQEVPKEKVYGLNDEWTVDGQWKLKITSVNTTAERNQFSKDNPAQVVIINYTYKNLGSVKIFV